MISRGRKIEAALALALARLALGALPFSVAMRWHGLHLAMISGCDRQGKGEGKADEAHRIGQAVAWAARRVPFRAVCLPQAMAAAVMLRRRGLPVEVRFGLARGREGAAGGDQLAAHAWCLSAGTPVTGVAAAGRFAAVAVYGA